MSEQLAAFRRELNWNIAHGNVNLPVVGIDGVPMVLVALEKEPLSVLLGRLRAVGGKANLFVQGPNRVRQVSFVEDGSTIPIPDDDQDGGERPVATESVGHFLDYLERHPNGVALPTLNPAGSPVARDTREVQFV